MATEWSSCRQRRIPGVSFPRRLTRESCNPRYEAPGLRLMKGQPKRRSISAAISLPQRDLRIGHALRFVDFHIPFSSGAGAGFAKCASPHFLRICRRYSARLRRGISLSDMPCPVHSRKRRPAFVELTGAMIRDDAGISGTDSRAAATYEYFSSSYGTFAPLARM